jgi:ubiquitin C-terminal hydrolase
MSLANGQTKRLRREEEGQGEEEEQKDGTYDTPVALERRDQIGSESAYEHIAEGQGPIETPVVHTESQGNSCEGHQGDQHRTEFHIENSSDLSTSAEKTNSTFKDESPTLPSEEPMQLLKEEKGVSGLANMRNTCYMNAALQALRHNTEISAFFLENRYEQWIQRKPDSKKVELVKAYADLLRSLWSASKPAYVRPTGFLQSMIPAAVEAGFDQFQVPLQHDSHEFLTFLLDQLHEGMAEEVNIEIHRPIPRTEQEKSIQKALEAWKRLFSKQYSPFTEMIYGLFRTTITCEACKATSDSWETFNCLKLHFHSGDCTLESMLKGEFQPETIEGYACEKCHPVRTTATKQTRIWRLPRMILISLKRFTMDGKKLYTNYQMPSNNTLVFKPFFSAESPEPSQDQPYECFASVDHHGSAGGGHYTAQAKSPLTDKWHHFDDETASSINEPQFGVSTYILFFKPSAKAAVA